MYYHASPVKGIEVLEPRISNHNIPLLYFSKKRENTLVYLCNAVERYCRETGFCHKGPYMKWGPYGFEKDGRQRIEEYYPDMLKTIYQGVSGYIYSAVDVKDSGFELQIPDAVTSDEAVLVTGVEFVSDAYEELLRAESHGLLCIQRYEDITPQKREWIKDVIYQEYADATEHPEYRHFLRGKFGSVLRT